MPEIFANGIKIHWIEKGTGKPVILIHGLSDDSAFWSPLLQSFPQNYRGIAVDIRGHGNSSKPNSPYSVELFTQDLLAICDALNIQSAHIIGFSIGGAIAQQLAIEQPERVQSLVLLSTFSSVDAELAGKFKRLKDSIAEGGLAAFFDEAINLVVTPEFAENNSSTLLEAKKLCLKINSPSALIRTIDAILEFDSTRMNAKILQPSLIIAGREDVFVPVREAEKIHHLIKGSEFKVVEGVGHNLLLPDRIQELSQVIFNFINSN